MGDLEGQDQVQEEVQWEAQEDLVQAQEEAQWEDQVVLDQVQEEVQWVVQVDPDQVQVEVQWEDPEAAALVQEDQVQALEEAPWVGLEDHLVAKEVSWMHLEVKVEEVLWEVLEDLEEADLAQEDLAQVQVEVQWEDQEA